MTVVMVAMVVVVVVAVVVVGASPSCVRGVDNETTPNVMARHREIPTVPSLALMESPKSNKVFVADIISPRELRRVPAGGGGGGGGGGKEGKATRNIVGL
ncbi:hypothetical protein E2C01_075538 [Portunus trituberculatus]|uniref:Secreted protein n=1 Tax=Portunus trituberculatus TaxID=210409 RepID=A0A5B7I8U3_PORTR|nr:hypothetical protein [Portunus trituberculatus]